jgi:hypothetical protein
LFNGSDKNFQFKNLGASLYAIEIFTLNILAHRWFSLEFSILHNLALVTYWYSKRSRSEKEALVLVAWVPARITEAWRVNVLLCLAERLPRSSIVHAQFERDLRESELVNLFKVNYISFLALGEVFGASRATWSDCRVHEVEKDVWLWVANLAAILPRAVGLAPWFT